MEAPTLDIAGDPGLQQQLERARVRRVAPPPARERQVDGLVGALFLAAAVVLAVATDSTARSLGTAAVLVVAYALALSIEFEVGPVFTVPTVLVLVPMLYLLPPGEVPLCVVLALLLAYSVKVLIGRRHMSLALAVLGQGWHALGPALVFALVDPGAASWDDLPILAVAFVAYVACDAAGSLPMD